MERQKDIVNKIILGSLAGAAVFIIIAFFADYKKVAAAFSSFPAGGWPFILFMSLANYAFRVIKWDFYLRRLDIYISKTSSLLIFLSGFIMAITPGKMGEVLKSLLMLEHYDIPVTRTAPAVFAERLTDVLALLAICAAGILAMGTGGGSGFENSHIISLFIVAAIAALSVYFLSNAKAIGKALKAAEKISFLKKHITHIETLFDSAKTILAPWPLAYTTFLSMLAWALECYSLYYIVTVMGGYSAFSLDLMLFCSFAYAFSTIAGALAMLPGGLFVTEGGMALLLVKLTKITLPQAVAAAFLVRLATLWFALLIGMAALPAFNLYAKNVIKKEPAR